ncbi:hypothetical protein GOP47_0029709 [Adiantum capillus-veneris]|nr:hypothetical protein GOP47_0029709 [Adiantum capillus-veneris]
MEEAAASGVPAEHREWVERLRHGGPTPLSLHSAPNSWTCPPSHLFSVRGADYMKTKAKVPASDSLLLPLAFDFLKGSSQISKFMNHPHSRVRAALDAALRDCSHPQHQPFVWAFNFQLDIKTHYSLIYYFVSFSSPPEGSLMQKFLDGDNDFRNSRLKLLTRFPEAPWLVQVVLGERWPVCVIGKMVKCSYTREKHYMEVDVDVGSTMVTGTAVNLTFRLTPHVVTDIAFALEGIDPDELPERILGAMRIVKAELSTATYVDMLEGSAANDTAREGMNTDKGTGTAAPQGIKARLMKWSRSAASNSEAGFK